MVYCGVGWCAFVATEGIGVVGTIIAVCFALFNVSLN